VVQVGGAVLDGRCRLKAAQEGGQQTVPARVIDLNPHEQALHVYRTAVMRRNLNDDQRAILAARYRELLSEAARKARAQKGGQAGGRGRRKADSSQDTAPQKLSEEAAQAAGASTRQQAAAQHNVPERKLRTAIGIERNDPELADKVLAGDTTLRQAKRQQKGAGEAQGPTRPDGPEPEPSGAANPTEGPGAAATAALPAEHAVQEGTGAQPQNGRPEGPLPPAEGASGGQAGYRFDQDLPIDGDGEGSSSPWKLTFDLVQSGVEELGTLLFGPDKRDRTEPMDKVEGLIQLLRRLREELNARAPAPSGRPPFES
jgi:hypothetical protein